MNKVWLKVFSLGVLGLIVTSPLPVLGAPLNDAIVAIVNSEVITLKDLKDYISGIYRQLKVEHKTPEEIQAVMISYEDKGINQLVEDKLILAAANEKGLEIRPEMVEKQLKGIKSRYPSEDEFLAALYAQGLTVTEFKNKILNQLKAKYMVDMEIKDKIFVNPEDVTRYYNDHKNEFESKSKYNLDSIFISFNKGKDLALKRITESRNKLSAGGDFNSISKEYTEAPSVGTLEQGQMVPAIEKEVFNLKVGDLSQPVQVEGGIYLFKVNGITSGRIESLQEVKEDIYNKIYEQQFQSKFKVWIDKLRNKAYVEIRS
ncbi:MAG: peptidyl-prolyl cis-trans isomerase [Candidatus Omnitrophota bacterium]